MRRAVVLGGSFAGLMAARVLSDHADDVVVIEPAAMSYETIDRGSPHRRQLHALLAMGHTQLERWLPGITQDLVDGGARLGAGPAVQFYVDGALKPSVEGLTMLGASRHFIEDHVGRRVSALPNVRHQPGQARGLLFQGGSISGVRFSTLTAGGSSPDGEIEADLVVDAMGRSSRLGTWLAEHGWDQPPVDRMRIDLGYATATFLRGEELPETVIAHSTPGPASGYQPAVIEPGAMTAVEGNRWSVVLAGYADYAPGRDPAEFLTRMRRCVAPLQEVADNCVMQGDVEPFHFRESQRRNYDKLTRFPGGLVVVGDALASVNPIYGQGLTLASLQASSLSVHLRSGADPHAPAWGYFRRAAAVVDAAWQLSSTADLAQPHVMGPYPRGYALLRWAGDKITEASVRNPEVNTAYMDVVHMRAHPKTLTRPRVLLNAARTLLTR